MLRYFAKNPPDKLVEAVTVSTFDEEPPDAGPVDVATGI